MLKWVLVPAMTVGLSLSSFCGSMAQAATMHGPGMEMMSVAERVHEPVPSCCLGERDPSHESETVSLPVASSETAPAVVPQDPFLVDRPVAPTDRCGRRLAQKKKLKFASRSLVKRE